MVDNIAAEAGDQREYPERRPSPTRKVGGGGLRIYKVGQGYYTRVWTAVGGAVLIVWGAATVYDQLTGLLTPGTRYYFPLAYGLSTAWVVGLSLLLYWIVGLNRKSNDFFIATEGEMKKVSWSSRREVIRSTKVVIVTTLLMGLILFIADLAFMWFFSSIKVLKGFPGIRAFFGA